MLEFQSQFVYDERRKELRASKIWTLKGIEEIKKILADLNKQRIGYEQTIKQVKEVLKEKPEMTKEMENLKKQLTDLQMIDLYEKQEAQLKDAEENLKGVKIDIDKIKKTIGSRLKL